MCERERKVKNSIFKLWIPPLRMTQSAPLQIDHFKWQLSQVGYRTEKIQKGYSEKQICKCPPCNKQILIFAFQNFFECTVLTENGQIPEDDLPRIGQIPTYGKPKSQKRTLWNQQPKAIFRGRAILAWRKPELIRILNWLFSGDWKTPVGHFYWTTQGSMKNDCSMLKRMVLWDF